MGAPLHDTDLTDINLAETNTDWTSFAGGAPSAIIDFAIQGTNCVARKVSNTTNGILYTPPSPIGVSQNDDHVFLWAVVTTPGIVDAKSAGGMTVQLGQQNNNYYQYYINGGDTLPQGGMQNYAIRYGADGNPDVTAGNPNQACDIFGLETIIVQVSQGDNIAMDALRYGTGMYVTDGVGDAISFSSSAYVNDLNANKWGVLTAVPGGFNLKGRYVVGRGINGATTQSVFADDNTFVVIEDTDNHTLGDFTQIQFDDNSTSATLDTINFTGVGDKNRGIFKVVNFNTSVAIDDCVSQSRSNHQDLIRFGILLRYLSSLYH